MHNYYCKHIVSGTLPSYILQLIIFLGFSFVLVLHIHSIQKCFIYKMQIVIRCIATIALHCAYCIVYNKWAEPYVLTLVSPQIRENCQYILVFNNKAFLSNIVVFLYSHSYNTLCGVSSPQIYDGLFNRCNVYATSQSDYRKCFMCIRMAFFGTLLDVSLNL